MLLKELLTLIGFTKIQQICLIKLLFITSSIGFFNPTTKADLQNAIPVKEYFLSSNIEQNKSSIKSKETISTETAELILENAKFDSKDKAFTWLDSILQNKFYRGNIERHEIEDKFKDSIKLNKLIQKFDLIGEIPQKGKFDFIIVTGCSEKCIRNKTLFLSRLLIEGKVKSDYIYFIGSERPAYPYLESSIESILAESLTKQNGLSFKENYSSVKKAFIKIGEEHLRSFYKEIPSKISEIRKIFKENPKIYNIQLLLDKLKNDPLLANIKWPTETDIILRASKKTLKKYHIKIIETQNKKVGSNMARSDTKDSAKAWLKEIESHPITTDNKVSTILLISNQPKSKYQFNVFKSILGRKYNISLAASSCYGKQNISLLLSELASLVHESKDLILNNE